MSSFKLIGENLVRRPRYNDVLAWQAFSIAPNRISYQHDLDDYLLQYLKGNLTFLKMCPKKPSLACWAGEK